MTASHTRIASKAEQERERAGPAASRQVIRDDAATGHIGPWRESGARVMNRFGTALFGFLAGGLFLRAGQVTPKAPSFGAWLFIAVIMLSFAFLTVIRS
jgi:hypothetical protein